MAKRRGSVTGRFPSHCVRAGERFGRADVAPASRVDDPVKAAFSRETVPVGIQGKGRTRHVAKSSGVDDLGAGIDQGTASRELSIRTEREVASPTAHLRAVRGDEQQKGTRVTLPPGVPQNR